MLWVPQNAIYEQGEMEIIVKGINQIAHKKQPMNDDEKL